MPYLEFIRRELADYVCALGQLEQKWLMEIRRPGLPAQDAQRLTEIRDLVSALTRTLEPATVQGNLPAPEQVVFTVQHLVDFLQRAADAQDLVERKALLQDLIDQRTPGMGNPHAPIAFCGMEAAIGLDKPQKWPNFAMEPLTLPLHWLAQAQPLVTARVWGADQWTRRPFARHPYDTYANVNGGHTWQKYAQLVTRMMELGVRPSTLLRRTPNMPGLGDLCYWFDLSATPAPDGRSGRAAPSVVRQAYLKRLIDALSHTRVLILHGDKAWDGYRDPLAAKFLGVDELPEWEDVNHLPYQRTQMIAANGRIVVRCRQLSNAIPPAFFERLADLLRPYR